MKLGKVSENVLKRSVLRQIRTTKKEVVSGAGLGEDCALFTFSDAEMATCVQEAAIACTEAELANAKGAEPFMTMGQLLQKTANNLAVMGATPVACMLAILLPGEVEEPVLKALMAQAEEACKELSLEIVGGQTRVSAAVTMPIVTVTGIGRKCLGSQGNKQSAKSSEKNRDVVISKWIGLQGTALLAKRNAARLLQRYPAYLVEEARKFDRFLSILPEAATAVKSGVCEMHDASEGGIFAALWELAERVGVGLTVDMKKLPLRQETVEVCEHCNANPYELMSGGCLVMFAEDGEALVEALAEQGIPACVVGQTNQTKDRILQNDEEIRYMDKPKQDSLYG